MADRFKRAMPGEPLRISADQWNAMVEAARGSREKDLVGRGVGTTPPPPGAIWCKNITGAARQRGDCSYVTVPLIARSANAAAYETRVTASAGLGTAFAETVGVWAQSVDVNAVGAIYVEGIVPARLDISNDGDLYADSPSSGALLKTGMIGQARILQKDSGTGSTNKWGIVRLDAARTIHFDGKLTTTLARNGTGTTDVRPALVTGNLGSVIGSTVPIVDTGKLTTTLPIGTVIDAVWARGQSFARLVGYDCDAV
jgi:hypothetical protein